MTGFENTINRTKLRVDFRYQWLQTGIEFRSISFLPEFPLATVNDGRLKNSNREGVIVIYFRARPITSHPGFIPDRETISFYTFPERQNERKNRRSPVVVRRNQTAIDVLVLNVFEKFI